MDEAGDIETLLDAVRALKWFICRESSEPAAAVVAVMDADMAKADTPTEQPTPPVATEPTTLDKVDIPAMIRAAVTEATQGLQDQLGLVKADLARMAALPVPGGPVGARTGAQTQAARDRDAQGLAAQAQALLTKADNTEDPALKAGYRDRAAALQAQATR